MTTNPDPALTPHLAPDPADALIDPPAPLAMPDASEPPGPKTPLTAVEQYLALSTRAGYLVLECMKRQVPAPIVSAVQEVQVAAEAYAMLLARDEKLPIPGSVQITQRFFSAEELEAWSRRIHGRFRRVPAYPRGQSLALDRLLLAIETLHAYVERNERAFVKSGRVLDAAGDIAVDSDIATPRLHIPRG